MPTQTLRVPTPDGQADAFAAYPDGGGRYPAVLMYMDVFGVRPVLEEMARELAGHGYYVLVPNFYYRHGPAPVVELPAFIATESRPEIFAELVPLLRESVTPERVLRDAEAYLDFLAGRPEVAEGPVAVTGYCIGAMLALSTAAAHPDRVAAVAGFHPAAVVNEEPDSPHLLIPTLAAEVHLGLAEGDMTPEITRTLFDALDAAGARDTCEIYPDTTHGFTMADTEAFSPSGLERHWERLLALLGRTLGKS
ncbi:dienelactone hydrolase family protein [Streptomyces sp. NPDC046203]|uniref:dienelactone hydrolase family protein n=1 Tax=Streptomyces sp. NPDC046203 TaxID=3154602 RepID=UPI0033D73684